MSNPQKPLNRFEYELSRTGFAKSLRKRVSDIIRPQNELGKMKTEKTKKRSFICTNTHTNAHTLFVTCIPQQFSFSTLSMSPSFDGVGTEGQQQHGEEEWRKNVRRLNDGDGILQVNNEDFILDSRGNGDDGE